MFFAVNKSRWSWVWWAEDEVDGERGLEACIRFWLGSRDDQWTWQPIFLGACCCLRATIS